MNMKSAHTPMSKDAIRKAAPSAFTENQPKMFPNITRTFQLNV